MNCELVAHEILLNLDVIVSNLVMPKSNRHLSPMMPFFFWREICSKHQKETHLFQKHQTERSLDSSTQSHWTMQKSRKNIQVVNLRWSFCYLYCMFNAQSTQLLKQTKNHNKISNKHYKTLYERVEVAVECWCIDTIKILFDSREQT